MVKLVWIKFVAQAFPDLSYEQFFFVASGSLFWFTADVCSIFPTGGVFLLLGWSWSNGADKATDLGQLEEYS